MVQSKSDRERQKLITDKCQSLIEVLLKDEDNKYCVDCDAKGPRWASWNLGVFLCIRCAGIHRNLGVHISKVKSVNLDAWTPEHVAYVQRMGNGRARAIYEANLPDEFRRPQTDTALESFIRAKYEHKKYIAQDYVDPGPPPPAFNIDEELKRIKDLKKSKMANSSIGGSSNSKMINITELASPKPRPTDNIGLKNKINSSIPGLVDLDTVAAISSSSNTAIESTVSSGINNNNDNSNINNKNTKSALDLLIDLDLPSGNKTLESVQPILTTKAPTTSTATTNTKQGHNIDLDFDFTIPSAGTQTGGGGGVQPATEKKPLTKESILSLYSMNSTHSFNNNFQ